MAAQIKQRLLITGANSQLANCLKMRVDDLPNVEAIFATRQDLDISQQNEVDEFIKAKAFEYCINCAAYTAVDDAENDREKAFQVNAKAVAYLAEACKRENVTLIHISTDFVFDGSKNTAYSEEDQPNPLNVYGQSKLKGEEEIRSILSKHFIIRTSWLYSEYGNNFVKTMLRLGHQRENLSVVSDQVGSPTYAGDLADCILKIIHLGDVDYGLYHFANRGETSWYGFACSIFNSAGTSIRLEPISSEAFGSPAKRPEYSLLNTYKIEKALSIEICNWQSSLKTCLQSLLNKKLES